jgi:hypothetical protein
MLSDGARGLVQPNERIPPENRARSGEGSVPPLFLELSAPVRKGRRMCNAPSLSRERDQTYRLANRSAIPVRVWRIRETDLIF